MQQTQRALLRPSADASALSPHPVPLFLLPVDLSLFAPGAEPLSCLSLAGIKQLNAWADYFRDSLPPVPKDNCHWVWGLNWANHSTAVRILEQAIDAIRDSARGVGKSSFKIQNSLNSLDIMYRWRIRHPKLSPLVVGCSKNKILIFSYKNNINVSIWTTGDNIDISLRVIYLIYLIKRIEKKNGKLLRKPSPWFQNAS